MLFAVSYLLKDTKQQLKKWTFYIFRQLWMLFYLTGKMWWNLELNICAPTHTYLSLWIVTSLYLNKFTKNSTIAELELPNGIQHCPHCMDIHGSQSWTSTNICGHVSKNISWKGLATMWPLHSQQVSQQTLSEVQKRGANGPIKRTHVLQIKKKTKRIQQ